MKKYTFVIFIVVLMIAAAGLNYYLNRNENGSVTVSSLDTDPGANQKLPAGFVADPDAPAAAKLTVPAQSFFENLFQERETARAAGDVSGFNDLISARGIEAQTSSRAGKSDAEFGEALKAGYGKMKNPDITDLPVVDFQSSAKTTLLIYEGSVVLPNGSDRIVTRLVQFVLESGQWKVDEDVIDYRGNQPREITHAPTITIEPNQ
jgi:hypothetical protein